MFPLSRRGSRNGSKTLRAGYLDSLKSALRWAFLFSILALLPIVPPAVTQAEVITSITPTTGAGDLGTIVTHTGNLYDITGGTRPGGGPNLYHSFGDFSVGAGNIATFLNTRPRYQPRTFWVA